MRVVSFDVGTRNFALCIVEASDTSPGFRILHWEVIDIVQEQNICSRDNIETKKCALLRSLHNRRATLVDELGEGDSVVIEQQPFGRGQGSPTMNILAHVIGAFFILGDPDASPCYSVRQIAARTKLAVKPEAWGGHPLPTEPVAAVAWNTWSAQTVPRCSLASEVLEQTGAVYAVVGFDSDTSDTVSLSLTFTKARKNAATAAKKLGVAPEVFSPWTSAGMPATERAYSVSYGHDPRETRTGKRKRAAAHRQYRVNKGHTVAVTTSILAEADETWNAWITMFQESKKKDDLADALTQALSQLTTT